MKRKLILFAWVICVFDMESSIAFFDLFSNKQHQAYKKYINQDYEAAYDRFSEPSWKGIAAIKSKQYDLAIENLVEDKTIRGKYNLGNAYAFNGEFDNAIEMYKDILKQEPGHLDAKHNLSIVEKLKQQADNQQNNNSNDKNQNKNNQKKSKKNNQKNNSNQSQDKNKQDKDKQSQSRNKKEKNKQDQKNNSNQNESEKNKNDPEQNKNQENNKKPGEDKKHSKNNSKYDEKNQADEQWLRTIQDDPGGLLKNKFMRDHLRRRKN